ncbi:MAG: HPt (histidine-containing phosphotransfer) domain-containing protein [Rickettsiales bacterium]|jgi:HPt (histidine-containing phosphotransfer) domain-containing protein
MAQEKTIVPKGIPPVVLPVKDIFEKLEAVKDLMEAKVPMDINFIKCASKGDVEFEKDIYILFLDSSSKNITKLEKAMNENDIDTWSHTTHHLRGSSAAIGAFPFSDIVAYAQANPKDTIKNKQIILDGIKAEFSKLADFLYKNVLVDEDPNNQ